MSVMLYFFVIKYNAYKLALAGKWACVNLRKITRHYERFYESLWLNKSQVSFRLVAKDSKRATALLSMNSIRIRAEEVILTELVYA